MKKFLLLYILLLQSFLFGCAACQLMIPTVRVNIDLNFTQENLTNAHIQWKFSDTFTAELLREYDKNGNDMLDKKELQSIQKAMMDYLIPKNMVTNISYAANVDDNAKTIKSDYTNLKLYQKDNNTLFFEYDIKMNLFITDNSMLSFAFQDDEGFFTFVVHELNIHSKELYHQENLYLFIASILFSRTPFVNTQEMSQESTQRNATEPIYDINATQQKVQEIKKESLQSNMLKESIVKIKSLFESIKDEKNPLTYIMLLLFAYLYGVIHALGPGHGKTLVASYFMSSERSYSKAFFVSLAIGVVHTFSAFVLTLIIYFGVNSFLSQFLNDTVFYTTKISALVIIFIAIYLLYKKYKAYMKISQSKKVPLSSFSTTPHVTTCSCASCKVDKDSTDLALIVSAGIMPCPGTITIFIFSLSLGLYYAGFLSALLMSLGMSTIIFFSAILSVAIRKKSLDTNSNLKKYLEYGSLVIILLLGLLLLFT